MIKHTDVVEERNASIFRVAELVPLDGGVTLKIETAPPRNVGTFNSYTVLKPPKHHSNMKN
jgi:hypothetical protein